MREKERELAAGASMEGELYSILEHILSFLELNIEDKCF